MAVRVEVNAHHWLIGFTLLASSALFVPAQAQTMAPDHAATTPGHGAITGGMANADIGRAPRGRLEKYRGLLRTTELDGADVYDEKGTDIGTVDDLLVNNSGKVDRVVISVGGFLGLGTHYVAIPFTMLKVQPSRAGTNTTTADGMGLAAGTGSMGTGTVATDRNTNPSNADNRRDGAGSMHGNAARTQYFSLVLPAATKDMLTKMPEFHYRQN
jgi:sporulation protein YlmC with PRC-barrel domain